MSAKTEFSGGTERIADVIVVGAGIAGLTAAALLARAGRSVIVLDKASHAGGRGITTVRDGIHLNLGPHALYCHGHAFRLLQELEVPFTGKPPSATGRFLLDDQRMFPLPVGLKDLILSRMLTIREKFRLVKLLSTLPKMPTQPLDRMPLTEWVEQVAGTGNLAAFLRTLFRVATYAADHEQLSAGAAIEQLQIALNGNVWYLDGGWQTIIDGLAAKAQEHGAVLRTSAAVRNVVSEAGGAIVELADGTRLTSRAAILATDPITANRLLALPETDPLSKWFSDRVPVHAACLDVALRRMPIPERNVAFGLKKALYYSVHSAVARLAPKGVAVIHVAKYLREDEEMPPDDLEQELEQVLDRMQPGWRDELLARRFFPSMMVTGALPRADEGGLHGRPAVQVAARANVFLAGDWVGPRGMLADAAAASAEEAVRRILGESKDATRERSLVAR